MIKLLLMVFMLINSLEALAEKPIGFLWYTTDKEQKKNTKPQPRGIPFNRLSFSERDAVLRFYTMEALHKARHTKSVADMRVFLSLQDYWLSESTRFKNLFQKTLLAYPQYDYTVTHPTSNLGAKITDEVRETHRIKVISTLAKSHGFLFFYRGKSPYDVKQISIITDFASRFGLALMPVSVDGIKSPELPHSRVDRGQANRLNVRYFPALLLVNPQSQQVTPVAYGLTTQDVLMERLMQVATSFQGALS
ncbi:TPA: type-F conjugative transfer system pilin assembly protein TraF [Legionella anisa]